MDLWPFLRHSAERKLSIFDYRKPSRLCRQRPAVPIDPTQILPGLALSGIEPDRIVRVSGITLVGSKFHATSAG